MSTFAFGGSVYPRSEKVNRIFQGCQGVIFQGVKRYQEGVVKRVCQRGLGRRLDGPLHDILKVQAGADYLCDAMEDIQSRRLADHLFLFGHLVRSLADSILSWFRVNNL